MLWGRWKAWNQLDPGKCDRCGVIAILFMCLGKKLCQHCAGGAQCDPE